MSRLTERRKIRKAKDQQGKCFYCSLPLRDDKTWEHIVARADGGTNKESNMAVCHDACNGLVGTLPAPIKHALHDIGHTLGSDAFFILAQRLKPQANSRKPAKRPRRPKRPPPPLHQANIIMLVRQLPDEMQAAIDKIAA